VSLYRRVRCCSSRRPGFLAFRKKQFQVLQFPNGRYEGEVNSCGERDGFGTFYWNDFTIYRDVIRSRVYAGHWKNDKIHGHGVETYEILDLMQRELAFFCPWFLTRVRLEGTFKDGLNGHGTFVATGRTSKERRTSEGEIRNGDLHGRFVGFETDIHGTVKERTFETVIDADGNVHVIDIDVSDASE